MSSSSALFGASAGSFGKPANATPAPKIAGIQDNGPTSAQESIPWPVHAGEFVQSALWLSRPYNLVLKESKKAKPGKK